MHGVTWYPMHHVVAYQHKRKRRSRRGIGGGCARHPGRLAQWSWQQGGGERERDVREVERGRDGVRFRERGRLIRV